MNNRRVAVSYFALIFATWGGLVFLLFNYQFVSADTYNYWLDSLQWRTPFNAFHVPGYPWLISLVRGVVGDGLPIAIMVFINVVALGVGLALVYQLLDGDGRGMVLFALWPLTGLAMVANPLADIVAIAWLVGGMLALQKQRVWLAAGLLAMALLTHKIMGLFVVGVWLVWWWDTRPGRTTLLLPVSLTFAPLTALWLAGAHHHNDLIWLVRANLGEEFASHSNLPILDGLLGTLLFQGWVGILQGLIVLGVLLLAGYLTYQQLTNPTPAKATYTLAITLPLLLLGVLLNQKEIWVVMRFGRLLILPLLWLNPAILRPLAQRGLWWLVVLLLVLSQFSFMVYMMGLV